MATAPAPVCRIHPPFRSGLRFQQHKFMAEAVLLAVTKIGSALGDGPTNALINKLSEKVQALKELPWKVDQIRMKLIFMGKIIQQIGTVYLTDELVKSWIGEEEGFLKKYFIKGTHYAIVFSDIADEVAAIEGEIQQVIQMKEQWLQPSQLVPHPDQLAEIERQRSQDSFPEFVKDEDLVGIEENRKLLTGWVYSEEQGSTVITVSGMGGLGKPTLRGWTANALINKLSEKVQALKELPWKVGQIKMKLIFMGKIIQQIGTVYLTDELVKSWIGEVRKVAYRVEDVVDKYSYHLLQLEEEGFLKKYFVKGTHYAIVFSDIADEPSQLVPHPDQLAEFERQRSQDSFPEFVKDEDLVGIEENRKLLTGWVYSEELGSTVITVSGMGGLGKSTLVTNIYEREKVNFPALQGSRIIITTRKDHVGAIASFDHHLELQPLCGPDAFELFCRRAFHNRKDHKCPEELQEIAGEIVKRRFCSEQREEYTREVAEGNLMELIHRNMLEVVDYDELGRVSTCKMHDIMRDLALCVAKEEKFGSISEYGELVQVDKNVRRLSLCGWNVNAAPKVQFPCLRTLVAQGIISFSPDMLSSIMSQSSYLTVLELQDSEITEVPAFIGNLFNLDEKQSEFRYFIGVQAPKGLLNLEELQTLETVQASKDLAEQLKKLMQLRSIWIDNVSAEDCANLFATISTMPLLSSLLISASDVNETLCLQALAPKFPKLHRLIVRGRWADETLEYPIFRNHGKHLKYLALSWCQLGEDPLGVLAPHVPNLTYLSFNRVNSASTLVLSAGCFPHLKTLVLKKMPDVERLEIGHGALPCIEGLYIMSLSAAG
ncbi:unnamed protein product [Miscanthus lutarioriparius]|uniref:Uncharacterized protein n=1 Tax=Miscanthus lutarioriparius TaxID=422564 RepID=A0A811Q7I1_9POAL|nr:unnamed protein product [Miscanthus lutarioriparius]